MFAGVGGGTDVLLFWSGFKGKKKSLFKKKPLQIFVEKFLWKTNVYGNFC